LLGDGRRASFAPERHLHIEAKLVHRGHRAHVVVAAIDREIRLVLPTSRIHAQLRTVDHDAVALQHGRVRRRRCDERIQLVIERLERQVFRPGEWR